MKALLIAGAAVLFGCGSVGAMAASHKHQTHHGIPSMKQDKNSAPTASGNQAAWWKDMPPASVKIQNPFPNAGGSTGAKN